MTPIKQLTKFILIFCFFIIGSKTLFSQIVVNNEEGCAPLEVNFQDPPGVHSTYYWDFKDGRTSNIENPSNTFTNPGEYIVEFKETPLGPVIETITITVYSKPVPAMTSSGPLRGCPPFSIDISDATVIDPNIVITDYIWTFGDGSSDNGNNVNYTYNNLGTFNVSLELVTSLPNCTNTSVFTDTVFVSQSPTANFTVIPGLVSCDTPYTVNFNENSTITNAPATYSWTFADGSTSTDQNGVAQTYTNYGNYPIKLVVTDNFGCKDSVTETIAIGKPNTIFSLPDTLCLNTSAQATNNSSTGAYSWTYDAGVSANNNTIAEPTFTFSSLGTKNITLRTTSFSGSCFDDTTITVEVIELDPTFTATPSYSCSIPFDVTFTPNTTDGVTYSWDLPEGNSTTEQNPTVQFVGPPDTTYAVKDIYRLEYTLTITRPDGCTATHSIVDTIWQPFARYMVDVREGCNALTVEFSDSSVSNEDIVLWEWDFGDGNTLNKLDNLPFTHTYTSAGDYYPVLIITNSAGCKDTSWSEHIQVGELSPGKDFTADKTTVCPGEDILFSNTTPLADSIDTWHFITNDHKSHHCAGDQSFTYSFNDSIGMYDVTMVVGYNGCYDTITKSNFITVNGPIADFTYTRECDTPLDVNYQDLSQGATSISWDFGDATSSTNSTETHTYTTGDYQVILTATAAGCPDSKDTSNIHIRILDADFTHPNGNLISDSLCKNVPEFYNASLSTDVHEYCNRGYSWLFSDPDNPPVVTDIPFAPITFINNGPQQIGLEVEDINGCLDTMWKNVIVYEAHANFSSSMARICLPDTLTFTDLSYSTDSIKTWDWNFGDGSVSNDTNPTHIFNSGSGSTTITLTVTDSIGCRDIEILNIPIYKPISNITATPTNTCVGDDVSISASDFTAEGSNLDFYWTLGDGNKDSVQSFTHAYGSDGTYTIKLHFTEQSSGCNDSITRTVNVQAYPNADFITNKPSDTICAPTTVLFTNQSTDIPSSLITSTNWDFGNGETSTNSNASTVFTNRTDPSKDHDTVRLIVATSYGCADTAYKNLKIVEPEANFDMDQNTICKGDSILFTVRDTIDVFNYRWVFGDGTDTSNVSPISHTYNFNPPGGQTVMSLVYSYKNGLCETSRDANIFIHEVVADFNRNGGDFLDDSTMCLIGPFTFTNLSIGADEYNWDFGDGGNSTAFEDPNEHTYATSGTYDVVLSIRDSQFGCVDTATKKVTLYELPTPSTYGDSICLIDIEAGSFAEIGVMPITPKSTYTWSPNDGLLTPNGPVSLVDTNASTIYTVTEVDSNGCSNTNTAELLVIEPYDGFDWDTIKVIGDYATIPAYKTDHYIFEWDTTDHLTCIDCAYPQANPLEKFYYQLTVTDILGCDTTMYNYEIDIHPETHIKVPTTFTPNGDGVNDVIYLKGWGIKELEFWRIYNRWGELIFETNNKEEGWNGYYKGKLQNNEIYVFEAQAVDWRGKTIGLQGHINLMR